MKHIVMIASLLLPGSAFAAEQWDSANTKEMPARIMAVPGGELRGCSIRLDEDGVRWTIEHCDGNGATVVYLGDQTR